MKRRLADDEAWTRFCFVVDLAHIFPDDADPQQLHAAQEVNGADHACPARYRKAHQLCDERDDDGDKADGADQHARQRDEAQRLYRKAGDAVEGKGKHFLQRVMAFTRNAFGALVVYAGAAVAHQRHKAAQEQVHFPELGQALQRAFAQQTVIGVIEHHIRSQRLHHFVKALGGGSFEPGVRLALGAHAVHHVHARQVFVDHRVHGVDVVLAVAVDGNGHVGQVLGGHQARQQSVLMAAVAGKADAPVMLVRFSQASDDVPGLILGTVVDEQYAAFVRYLARCGKVFDFFQEHAAGQGQHGLFIVTGNHDIQNG